MPALITPPNMPEDRVAAAQLFGNFAKLHLMHTMSRAARPMTMRELADELGTTKQSIRLYLRELEAQGLVTADAPSVPRRNDPILWSINDDQILAIGARLVDYARGRDEG